MPAVASRHADRRQQRPQRRPNADPTRTCRRVSGVLPPHLTSRYSLVGSSPPHLTSQFSGLDRARHISKEGGHHIWFRGQRGGFATSPHQRLRCDPRSAPLCKRVVLRTLTTPAPDGQGSRGCDMLADRRCKWHAADRTESVQSPCAAPRPQPPACDAPVTAIPNRSRSQCLSATERDVWPLCPSCRGYRQHFPQTRLPPWGGGRQVERQAQ